MSKTNNNDFEIPNFKFEVEEEVYDKAVIRVIGVGGGGGNAVTHMLQKGMQGVDFCAANTDVQALYKIEQLYNHLKDENSMPYYSIKLGHETTKGLGAGARPDIGQKAVQESIEEIKEYLDGADMVFITAGMGGGTGTGGASVIASLAKQMGILTVGVVTKPFLFEGKPRSRNAEQGIKALSEHVDSLIIIPNEKLIGAMGKNMSLISCFETANNVLYNAVHGISDLITRPGLINVDFADVKTVMSGMGITMMGTGIASNEDRANKATLEAISSPLLDTDIKGAKGILVNIIADHSLSIGEFNEIGGQIRDYADPDANIVIGSSFDPNMKESIMVTLVATGVESDYNRNNNIDTTYQDNSGQADNSFGNNEKTDRVETHQFRSDEVHKSSDPVPETNVSMDRNDNSFDRQDTNRQKNDYQDSFSIKAEKDDFPDAEVGRARVVSSPRISEEERRQEYLKMKDKKTSFFGRKVPNIGSDQESTRGEESNFEEKRPTGLSRFLSKRG